MDNILFSKIILASSAIVFAAAFLFHIFSFYGVKEGGEKTAFRLMRGGFLLSTFYFVSQAIGKGAFLPVINLSQALAFFAWTLAFVYLVLLVRIHSDSFGIILNPILFLLTFGAALSIKPIVVEAEPTWALGVNPYFKAHIICAFFAYACFTLSFAAGILYLIQNHELKSKKVGTFYRKLPSLEELERLIYKPLAWGAPLLLLAVCVGFLWSKSVYGEYWIFDPKTITTLITVGLYCVILYLRSSEFLRGKQVAVWSLIAFCFVVVSFVGPRFIQGSHNYLQ